jgi:hypothetical protein
LNGEHDSSSNQFKKLNWASGSVFKGQITKNDIPDGVGILELDNGDFYEGEFKDGMFHGLGILKMSEGKYYEGFWSMNMREGKGRELWSDGKQYEGEFKNDSKNGYGRLLFVFLLTYPKVLLNGLMAVFTQDISEMMK